MKVGIHPRVSKICFTALLFFSVIFLIGCAIPNSTVLLTGTKRPSISVEQVEILPKIPANVEMIGIITANGVGGVGRQKKLDTALVELKRQAALIGANALVLVISDGSGNDRDENQKKGININVDFRPVTLKGKALYLEYLQ